jgi:hypothetical protein
MDWNSEWSRRAKGFATYAAIQQMAGWALRMIDRSCGYATRIVEGIGALDGAEILRRPRIIQGLVRFLDPREGPARRITTGSRVPSFGAGMGPVKYSLRGPIGAAARDG